MPLQIVRQDITKMKVDAIVNTTNEDMVGYSGVDLAVHTIAGVELDKECVTLPPLGLGQAQITGGYNLPCKYVIHTSGPRWYGGLCGESAILRSCYVESLKLAVKHGCESVAFPLISAGVYQYPKDQVLKFAIQTITEFLLYHELTVYLCVYDKDAYSFSQKLFSDIKTFIDDDYVDEHGEDFYESLEFLMEEESDCAKAITMPPSCCASTSYPYIPEEEEKALDTRRLTALEDYIRNRDMGFREKLFALIDAKGMTDVACYKKANVDKRTFSKIKSNKNYKPSKQTAIAFAIALELDLDGTQELLATLGFTLSKSSVFDKIIRYFIHVGNYNIFEINEALFEFDQTLLGV